MDSAHRLAATHMREWLWSRAEKTAARHAFDVALGREFEAVIRDAQGRTARIADGEELWELECWLAARRREINRTYDFRYSVLPLVFRSNCSAWAASRRRNSMALLQTSSTSSDASELVTDPRHRMPNR
jgi:hypothetical protein